MQPRYLPSTVTDPDSPYGERRIGALTAMKARAPVLGGNFGVWGGLFSTYDCAVKG
jgi:mitochondrial import inner membrane translocase subunit TIM17